jgi:hypothetical protein
MKASARVRAGTRPDFSRMQPSVELQGVDQYPA